VTDIGLQLVDFLYEQLMVDDQWAVRRRRGFTWWAHRLAQHVEVGPPVWETDRHVCAVRIWTEVARDVDPALNPARVLGVVNAQATLSALVWDRADATVTECCTAQIHEGIFGWMSRTLATIALLQNTDAHARAATIACGGTVAATPHPIGGERPEPDEILNVLPAIVLPEGAAPSRFAGPAMQVAQEFMAHMGLAGSADETGLTCEVPFTGETPFAALPPGAEPQTSLLRIFTDQPHPRLGNGALVLLQLPLEVDEDAVAALANSLNLAEAAGDTGTLLLGAWCADPTSAATLAFCGFIPNALARLTRVDNVIAYQASRSRFAARFLLGR
jgi:hypothetical protein